MPVVTGKGVALPTGKYAVDHDLIRQAMARYSLRSASLLRDMERKREKKAQASGAMKRAAQEVLGPYRFCFQSVHLPAVDAGEEDIKFFVADVRKVLDLVCRRCPSMQKVLTSTPGGKIGRAHV